VTNCPKCNESVTEEDRECPKCGILFGKWKEREDNVATGNVARYSGLAAATSSEFNWTILVIVCAVIVGIFYFIGHRVND
jgi:uncharacterized membrane protein YvbJ